MGLAGFHPRLTVLQAGPHERSPLTEHLARLLGADHGKPAGEEPSSNGSGQPVGVHGPDDLEALAGEKADLRVEEHGRLRDELNATLRTAGENQAAAAARRDEAAARARRMASHLQECEALLEDADGLNTAVDEANGELEEYQQELEEARERLAVVLDQRQAATAAIEDARSQLQELEAAELDEVELHGRMEQANEELREIEEARAETTAALQELEAAAYERNARREQLEAERAELAVRIEAPLYDPAPLRAAVDAFDEEAEAGEVDMVAQGLATEWLEVADELERIEAALPPPPSDAELSTAEQQLGEIEGIVAELEATSRHSRLDPQARAEIEAAHEAVLAAEEALDQSGGHPELESHLEAARYDEQQILTHYGYGTYLDLVMAEPEPAEAQSELMEALRARRHAEDTLASLWAATEPPPVVLNLEARRERIYRDAAELLCTDPGERILELLQAHPVVPPTTLRNVADVLAAYGVYPSGVSVRDAAIDLLLGIEREMDARDALMQEVEQLDAELLALDDQDVAEAGEAQQLMQSAQAAADDVAAVGAEIAELEQELHSRTTLDERHLQRVEAAEELRAQITAVSEALERSDDEYHHQVAESEAAVTAAEAKLEQATAAVSDAVRHVRTIGETLPPALRPRATDDMLAELPRLHEALASEVERAEAAITSATREIDRADELIEETQADLDRQTTTKPSRDVEAEDLRTAMIDLVGVGEVPTVLDDPLTSLDETDRQDLLEVLADASSRRPIILLTDDAHTLSWAISLPEEIGTVTGLPVIDEELAVEPDDALRPTDHPPGAATPSSP